MSNRIKAGVVVFTMSLSVFALAGVHNLIPNPGFEEVDAEGHPAGFTQPYVLSADNSLNPVFRRTDFQPHGGRYCAEYRVHNSEGFIATRNRRIALKPGACYRFSAWLKTDTDPVMGASIHSCPQPGVHVNLFPTLQPGWTGPWPKQGLPLLWAGGGESDWRQYVGYFRAHETTKEVWVALYVTNVEGAGWFDDLELCEVPEAEASGKVILTDETNIVTAEDVVTTYADGENLVFNGSFEIAANPDMPDFVRYPIGVAWFDREWKVKRVADPASPHGGHYFHLDGGRDYQSDKLRLESGRPFTLSFAARSENETKIKVSFSGDPKPRKYVKLTNEWKRYSFPFAAMDKSLERSKHNVFIEHFEGEDFDLDAVCLSYGTNGVFRENRDDVPYVKLAERFARPQTSPAAPKEGLAVKPMFPSALDWRRDVLFTDERQVFRAVPDEEELSVVITTAQGKVVFDGKAARADLLAARFKAGPFPAGVYGIRGSAGTFRVVPRQKRWCRTDRFAHMAETEKGPYIPCATGFAMAERFKDRVPEVAKLGFNTLYGWSFGKDGKTSYDETYTENFLKNCETNGLDVIMTTPLDTTKTFPEILKRISDWQRRWIDAPAIRMWHNYDEVYNYWCRPPYGRTEADIQTTKDRFSETDPCRLTWNNSTISGRIFGGNHSTDITSATIYTLRDNLSGAPSTLRAADRLVAAGASAGNNPAITGIWLQFYSGEGESGSFSHEPSVNEMTLMLYGCLVRGVRAFWLFNMRPRSTILYHETGRLFREIDGMRDILFGGEYLPFAATHEKIVGTTVRYGGKTYVISVNNSYATVTASVRLPVGFSAGTVRDRFTGKTMPFRDFQVRTTWGPCERIVWEFRSQVKTR